MFREKYSLHSGKLKLPRVLVIPFMQIAEKLPNILGCLQPKILKICLGFFQHYAQNYCDTILF